MPDRPSRWLRSGWRASLDLGFSLLCARFLFAAIAADWTQLPLGLAALGIAWWRPAAAPFVLALCFAFLGGLGKTVLPFPALLLVASSMWLGMTLGKLARRIFRHQAEMKIPVAAEDRATLVVDLLATVALASVLADIWHHRADPGFFPGFWRQTVHAPADPAYFLTSSFLWLHGLFYFHALRSEPASGALTPGGIRLVFGLNALVLLFFFGVQAGWEFPFRWTPGFQSPFEDIGTFGAMAACFLVFHLALLPAASWRQTVLHALGALLLAVAVVLAWSRGTWLAASIFVGLLALLRLPRLPALLLLGGLAGAVLLINLNTARMTLPDRPYLERLVTLVRFEGFAEKFQHSGRLDLYRRSLAMIRARPLAGHGLGSFYRTSPAYARPGETTTELEQPHNILLQLAAEQGLPAALLFAGLMFAVLRRGIRGWLARDRKGNDARLMLALVLVLGLYLEANLTWDLLLVHLTQPFFFWFLIAALLAVPEKAPHPAA
jgi:O-antigen ligase